MNEHVPSQMQQRRQLALCLGILRVLDDWTATISSFIIRKDGLLR